MGKSKKRKEYSLKKIVLMVFACSSLLCLLLIIFVTRISMKAMRESKMETSLKATLEEVNQGFESEYNVLLRLSQVALIFSFLWSVFFRNHVLHFTNLSS